MVDPQNKPASPPVRFSDLSRWRGLLFKYGCIIVTASSGAIGWATHLAWVQWTNQTAAVATNTASVHALQSGIETHTTQLDKLDGKLDALSEKTDRHYEGIMTLLVRQKIGLGVSPATPNVAARPLDLDEAGGSLR